MAVLLRVRHAVGQVIASPGTLLGVAVLSVLGLMALPAAAPMGLHVVGAAMMDPPPTITFPTVDLTSLSANVGAFFSFLAPVLWLVGGIAIGGILLHKARGLM